MNDYRIYAACLASYNNGVLHGRWIDCDCGLLHVQEEIAEMLRESPYPNVTAVCPECEGAPREYANAKGDICETCGHTGRVPTAEEYAVHDYDGIPSEFGEHPDLGEIVEYVDALESLEDSEAEAFAAWMADDSTRTPDADAFREDFQGVHRTLEDWAAEFIEETGALADVPDDVARYFDFAAYARDARLGGDVWTADVSDGVAVFWNH